MESHALVILALALALDLAFGEPPNLLHPVSWFGRLAGLPLRYLPAGKRRQFIYGASIVIVLTAGAAAASFYFLQYLKEASMSSYLIIGALMLKSTFSIRGLRRAAHNVRRSLEDGDLGSARQRVRSLVSRDVQEMSEEQVVSATVESTAENASDSFLAPLLYFLVFGVPGAIAYRAVNTFDAMIGYHGKYEYLGKFAARLDDVMNFIPARISALLVLLAAFVLRHDVANGFKVMLRDHSRTESPNAGWPMSAAAGALRVRLEKAGHYLLGDPTVPLTTHAIGATVAMMDVVAVSWVLICLAVEAA